jgi:uncharacterized protein
MRFTWDPKKAISNLKKHKVSFEEATTVFYDDLSKITPDPDHSKNEERLILIGYSQKSNLLFIVHAYKEDDQLIRIISARKATKKEKNDYENY